MVNKKNRFKIFYALYSSKGRGSRGLTITEIAKHTQLKPETINSKNNLPFLIEKFLVMESLKHRGRYQLSKAGGAAMAIMMKKFIKYLKGVNNQTVEEILYGDEHEPSDKGCLGRDISRRYKCIINGLREMAPRYLNWIYDSSCTFFSKLDIFSAFTMKPKKPLDVCNGKVRLRCTGKTHSIYSKKRGKIPVKIIKPSGFPLRNIGHTWFGEQGNFDWFGDIPKKSKKGTYKFIAKYQLHATDAKDPDVGFGKWVKEFKVKPCK